MNAIESTEHYKDRIKAEISNTLTNTSLKEGIKKTGKVRDQYDLGEKIAIFSPRSYWSLTFPVFFIPSLRDVLVSVFDISALMRSL